MKLFLLICINECFSPAGKPLLFPDKNSAVQALNTDLKNNAQTLENEGMECSTSFYGETHAELRYGSEYSYNWIVTDIDIPLDLPVSAKLEISKELVSSIPDSNYWPFRSPAPCTTECRVKDAIRKAISALGDASGAHHDLYGNGKRNENKSPRSVICEHK